MVVMVMWGRRTPWGLAGLGDQQAAEEFGLGGVCLHEVCDMSKGRKQNCTCSATRRGGLRRKSACVFVMLETCWI